MRLYRRTLLICLWIVVAFLGTCIYVKQIRMVAERTVQKAARENTSKIGSAFRVPAVATEIRSSAIYKQFVEMKFGSLYVFGVAAGNSSANSHWDLIKIYGALDRNIFINHFVNRTVRIRCCLAYREDSGVRFIKVFPSKIKAFAVTGAVRSLHVTCLNVRDEQKIVPVGAALTVHDYSCSERHVTYVTPYFPVREAEEKVAIGTKTAYGNVSAELIIEWMEAYKFLGVDKVVTYYIKSLNEKALRVLQYYASTGILDLIYYEPAASDKYPRDTYNDHTQRQNDQEIVVNDSFERMSGYKYFGIIDFDEFLFPFYGTNIKEMMRTFYGSFPNATGLTFASQYYFLSWGKSNNDSDMILGSYIKRTRVGFDNYKNLYMPERVAMGGADTHEVRPRSGYKMHRGYPMFGIILHYRQCRMRRMKECMHEYDRIVDNRVATWAEQFRDKVVAVREVVFGSNVAP